MFRRTKAAEPTSPTAPETSATATGGGKGRPTPSRKEAEAAARARAKVPRTRKEIAAAQKLSRRESSMAMRQAMKTGDDDRALPPRDRGPVRRFTRDLVDSRFTLIELFIPIMLVVLILGYAGSTTLRAVANSGMFAVLLLMIFDMVRLRFRLRREIAGRFPDASPKGLTYYAITRAMQMRFMRMPKTRVRIGQSLPEHYR